MKAPLRTVAMALLLGTAATATAQDPQQFADQEYEIGNFEALGIGVYDGPDNSCANLQYRYVQPNAAWGEGYPPNLVHFRLDAGTGVQQFDILIKGITQGIPFPGPLRVRVDGEACANCIGTFVSMDSLNEVGPARWYTELRYRITHTAGYAYPDGIQEFGFTMMDTDPLLNPGATPIYGAEFRFKAVMVGTAFSEIMGYYTAPALPLYILRDPPGNASYSSITTSNDVCTGSTTSLTTGDSQNGYFKVRIGVAGTIPFAGLDYSIYGEVGVDVSASQTETALNEYQTCLSTTSTYTTPTTGAPEDVFIGSAVRYAYGVGFTTSVAGCVGLSTETGLVAAPVGTTFNYNYREGQIRNSVIPELITEIDGMEPGADRDRATTQLDVWNQTLAMNDSIKAHAPYETVRDFVGGPGEDHSLTVTTTDSYSIDYEAQLESGLSFEIGVNIGGSGITTGGAAKFQNGYGRGENGSNVATNTVQYHLEDTDSGDDLSVKVFRDEVFGTYVFQLDSAFSETSCPYEGGYQIDQPRLSVGTPGNTHMVINEAPIGNTLTFPLYICNESQYEMSYNIKVRGGTNTEGGTVVVLGENISSDILGQECESVPANGCYDVTSLFLTDPNTSDEITDFIIELYLYSPCEPSIRSSIIIEAHFGVGNFGDYCVPFSEEAGSAGDHIDGVQIGAINNTGSGPSTTGYTDYSGQFSTPLSRNAQRTISVTTGPMTGTHYSAWIDYDRNNIFDDNERLGSFTNGAPGEVRNITFTVPATALLGTTVMRVRGVREDAGIIAMVDACFGHTYGETEDYAVVINANTPQDCAGVNNGTALPGTPCNDNNANTGNDTWNANCQCVGQLLDCVGTPGGTVLPGSPCDDGNANTASDTYNTNCQCVGLLYDCLGIPGGAAVQGSPCDDGIAATGNDVYTTDCTCAGQLLDCLGVAGGITLPGTPCNDNNAQTTNDVYTANCVCAGILEEDCAGTPGGTAQPGTPCDDGNTNTGNDVYGNDCSCAGLPYDCAGIPGGSAAPGTPCNDGSALTTNDVYNANCICLGTAAVDCLGIAGGAAQPGTPCDDNNANTGNDTYNVFCQCLGQLLDCTGTPGGNAMPGTPCDDGNASTANDAYTLGCECVGQLITSIADADGASYSFTVQPNPSTGLFTFNNPAQKATWVEVRDALGRMVMRPMLVGTSRASTIDLSDLASGTYHLVAEAEGHRQVIKIMVQR